MLRPVPAVEHCFGLLVLLRITERPGQGHSKGMCTGSAGLCRPLKHGGCFCILSFIAIQRSQCNVSVRKSRRLLNAFFQAGYSLIGTVLLKIFLCFIKKSLSSPGDNTLRTKCIRTTKKDNKQNQ